MSSINMSYINNSNRVAIIRLVRVHKGINFSLSVSLKLVNNMDYLIPTIRLCEPDAV